MVFLNAVKISYKNLLATKLRSFLTILGIIIGVASVIIIFAIGQSAQELILDQIRGIGSNLVIVLPGASEEDGPPAAAMGVTVTTLQYDDLLKLKKRKNVPEVEDGAGYVMGTGTAKYNGTELGVSFTGTTKSYLNVENTEIIYGRFFNEQEEVNLSKVAALGITVASDLFGDNNIASAIGKKIKVNDYKFTVIGILEDRETSAFGMAKQNDTIFVPVTTAQKLLLGIKHLGFIRLKIDKVENIISAKENVKETLRRQHDIDNPDNDDFSVRDQASAIKIVDSITDALRYFLLSVGVISLVVGGVGIMNVMLIAVNQRIREVGLRKAVGAKNIDVLIQFLVESAVISFLGGVIGMILGIAVAFLVTVAIRAIGYNWQFLVSWQSIIVAMAVSILIGLIFGLYPARKATRISPIEALRNE